MRKVYKVVNREGRKRVSAQAPHWRRDLPEIIPFIRTYSAANHRKMLVSACLAFCRLTDARDFVDVYCVPFLNPQKLWRPEIWLAECESARGITRIACPTPLEFTGFARAEGRPDGWRGEPHDAPFGTLYCKNLRLLKRVDS